MTDDETIGVAETLARGAFGDVALRTRIAAGGVLVEAIGQVFSGPSRADLLNRFSTEVIRHNNAESVVENRIVVWSLFTYVVESERFRERVSLKTRRSGYSAGGEFTTYVQVGDVAGYGAELDTEALIVGADRPYAGYLFKPASDRDRVRLIQGTKGLLELNVGGMHLSIEEMKSSDDNNTWSIDLD